MPAPLIVLTLDAALDGCAAGLVAPGRPVIEQVRDGARGSAAVLPAMAASVLAEAGLRADGLDAIAVTVGPGSFTGVRAALALAQGIGLAAGVPVWGATVGAAIRAGVEAPRPVWVAIDSKRGRVFLDMGDRIVSVPLDALPTPAGLVSVAGDAAASVVARVSGAVLLDVARPGPAGIARAAAAVRLPAQPLYIDAPEARPNPARQPPVP